MNVFCESFQPPPSSGATLSYPIPRYQVSGPSRLIANSAKSASVIFFFAVGSLLAMSRSSTYTTKKTVLSELYYRQLSRGMIGGTHSFLSQEC